MISSRLLQPCFSSHWTMPCFTFMVTAGSMKLAVPICMAVAPAIKNSMASSAFMIPPSPMTGICRHGPLAYHPHGHGLYCRTAQSTPADAELGWHRSMSMAMPMSVLMARQSRRLISQARAMSAMRSRWARA